MKSMMWRAAAGAIAALGMALSGAPALAQQKSEIALSRQPGIFYMPSHIMEKQKLIEKHAAALGLAGITTKWLSFNSGGAQTDALLAGGVDILNTGTGNLLLLWDRTRGGVKGIVATSAQPMTLISRDANIKSLKDIGPNDKIAVPTVKVSTQAIVLQIAAAELFGADQWSKLDPNTVQLGHPDAYVAMTNAQHEVRNHFAIPPFTFLELKNVPGAHVVLSSPDVMGGPLSQAQFFTTTKFADANPKIVQAVRDATKEAQDLIRSDTKAAVDIYKEVTGDKTSAEDLLAWLKEPGMMEWNLQPQGTMKFANHLFKVGTLKTQPKAWTEYYLPMAHDLKGN
ncbi:ABC transporter substrate-binding protein [Bradyrhizobium sp. AUGA SZCCT0176]|uniref:ABC transporter substrate-binding protein n=2 Tax=Bradyrhizobium TaxID=374 RepID=UPI001BA5F966|nr:MULTISPECIES: ABC transporter substrate-binding protein [unclassified Bradyrhizobium]MBR1229557.1 ABC transporter substrate-binding protein [Bradyrhizobium sp. AUGA SZCCT0176]MBR1236906.1 ABC transporter substrate-binding protein [Bradyrhizobium sp. AUGA SZCCT0182]MBR1286253.1 ABC transporter substrate-binding protein [Bradyrhizobium sp. AUGA SZCCT0177]MBR1301361.1 ABC transporter substrate-binding protein [Bradyrhizobium sp. AUGA SZCCT0042]